MSSSMIRSENRQGCKVEQENGPGWSEDRCAAYRRFRTTRIGVSGGYDVDQLEWRLGADGNPVPVAMLELTRADSNDPIPPSYLAAILHRIDQRDFQGKLARMVAERLGVKAWVVLFRHNLRDFWIYNLTDKRGWWYLDQEGYRRWIESLSDERSQ